MKIIIFLSLLFTNIIFSQDSIKPFFNGFGLLKVNQTTISVIKELETLLDTKTRIINNIDNDMKLTRLLENVENSNTNEKYGVICILLEDSINYYNSPIQASTCDKVKIYRIGGYSVAGIKIKNLRITFYNDTLTEINCENTTELMEAIRLKYGEGVKKIKKEEIECTLKLTGNVLKYEEIEITENWESNDIIAYDLTKKYFDDKCNPKYINYLNIYSRNKTRLMNDCEESVKTRRKNQKNEEKRKTLNDF